MLDRPVESVVRDLFPAGLSDREMGAAGELLVLGHRAGVRIMFRCLSVDGGRHNVVSATRDQEQRRALVVVEVHARGGVRIEVGQGRLEKDATWTRYRVALEGLQRVLR